MKEIIINSKKYGQNIALIEDEDYEKINQFKWRVQNTESGFYAVRWEGKKLVYMHRQILCINNPKTQIDHEDHNGLNNLRSNLRVATYSQNGTNRRSKKCSASKYLGVSILNVKDRGKIYTYWRAIVSENGANKWLGCFKTQEAAASAYNSAAIKIHGKFANLNII